MKINVKTLIYSIVAGIVMTIVGNLFYNASLNSMPRILIVGIFFAIFAVVLGIIIAMAGKSECEDFAIGKVGIGILAGLIAGMAFGCLFEFLYEIEPSKNKAEFTNYVFAVDCSGSMDGNDPNNQREQAVMKIANSLPTDKKVAVYTFGDGVESVVPLGSLPPGRVQIPNGKVIADGGTPMYHLISKVNSDLASAEGLTNLIILTDGVPTDAPFFGDGSYIKRSSKSGISISSVGFGSDDSSRLERLASRTGGVYVHAENADDIVVKMQNAANAKPVVSRDIIGVRGDKRADSVLHGILRILFLILLGAILGFVKLMAFGGGKSAGQIILTSVIFIVAGAVLTELLMAVLPEIAVRCIMCVLFSLTIAKPNKIIPVNMDDMPGNGWQTSHDFGIRKDLSEDSENSGMGDFGSGNWSGNW